MLDLIADLLTANIDDITREWVEELRSSDRTDIHKQLLTAEIVDGIKTLLLNLAETLGDTPLHAQVTGAALPTANMSRLPRLEGADAGASSRPRGTMPLNNPLIRAGHIAASHGKLRHNQGYEFHEVVIEFVKLRQIILRRVLAALEAGPQTELAGVLLAFDLLFDELMLKAVEHFHQASVRDLEKRAIRDPMTQLYNREYFGQRLGEEMRRALRSAEPLTVAMIDMDRLKEINDTYGHAAGDSAIQAVASAIRHTCRRADVPCRFGGDEFAVILPETDKMQARVFAERLMRSLATMTVIVGGGDGTKVAQSTQEGVEAGNRPLGVPVPTISVGIASFPDDARNPETLVAQADAALYRAKHAGRNSIAI
jgi:diguanylate cyclase (GGDEF)-like protein